MESGLYGPGGFFVRPDAGPADHFRTSVHASPLFAGALLRLIERIDTALGRPATFDLVDVGAGRGELLATLRPLLPERVRLTGVEVAPAPPALPGGIAWRRDIPDNIVGLLIATEWLDNVPLDVADLDDHGRMRQVLVDPATGAETLGGLVDAADLFWLRRWWPEPGRVEIGWPRDAAWADAVHQVRRGYALAIDYGHVRAERPMLGTLTGFRGGRPVTPVPDGSCDVTAHVAIDAVASAAGTPYGLIRQRDALQALGIDGARPPLALARTDPAGYVRALSAAGAEAELIEPSGLGGHWWLLHSVGLEDRGSILG
ncbi:SAM-dependent methyltransferase [Actinoplanes bogorensis]|uniref:SAM-dependent methyltransferase n=1 Tax=Paractinoplanes bogorensis TaxID=1610840 RepID=A0ABS5YIG0_9ACTN|nr:SAM-dependent methyltransferase [Actinoplanes bogorensis]MBU2663267.1 SAM-dependent methyltransferase [Actinoplanes bogorensis]